jgi:peroxiredoxin
MHIGNDVNVKTAKIIGIFDIDTASYGKGTKVFLEKMQKSGRVLTISSDLPRSVILADDESGNDVQLYVSPISTVTIAKRGETVFK